MVYWTDTPNVYLVFCPFRGCKPEHFRYFSCKLPKLMKQESAHCRLDMSRCSLYARLPSTMFTRKFYRVSRFNICTTIIDEVSIYFCRNQTDANNLTKTNRKSVKVACMRRSFCNQKTLRTNYWSTMYPNFQNTFKRNSKALRNGCDCFIWRRSMD